MEIRGINCNRELIAIITTDELNEYIEYLKAEANRAYNKGWADAQDQEFNKE